MTTGKEESSKAKADGGQAVKKRRGPKKKPQRDYGKGRWTDEERILFLVGLRKYGKGKWKEISKVLTTRNPVQIKSHGQKLYSKLKEGKDIFFELNEYERLTGMDLQPTTDGTCPLPTATSGDEDSQDAPSLVHSSSNDESQGIALFESEANEENRPPFPAKPNPIPFPPNVPTFVPSSTEGSPLLQTHFGIPTGISFVNASPQPMPSSKFTATTGTTGMSPAQNQRDVLAAMVLCKLGTMGNATQPVLAPTATHPSFSPKDTTATTMPTFSSSSGSAFDAYEPIPLQQVEQQDQELLAACFPTLLQDDEDDSSNVVTPTNIAEV